VDVYFTDRGIEELADRRGDEQVLIAWLAERLREYVDEHPEAEATIDNLATWLARLDEEDEDEDELFEASAAGLGEPDDSSPESAE
jgi:ABC-type transporter Mla subunit MlaD